MLAHAVNLFRLTEGRLPNDSEWPKFLFAGSKNHPAPYITHRVTANGHIHDPWGNPYIYRKSGASTFEVISYGADGAPGGQGEDADISFKKDK
ncbi:MAG: type II secretion system protein GspG, partial [Planctomycetota bacterium]|nr:type II secretion system protein GspG [Planctomycetota bacterium]